MNEIRTFLEEHFQQFIDWLERMGFENPEEYAEECLKELEGKE